MVRNTETWRAALGRCQWRVVFSSRQTETPGPRVPLGCRQRTSVQKKTEGLGGAPHLRGAPQRRNRMWGWSEPVGRAFPVGIGLLVLNWQGGHRAGTPSRAEPAASHRPAPPWPQTEHGPRPLSSSQELRLHVTLWSHKALAIQPYFHHSVSCDSRGNSSLLP